MILFLGFVDPHGFSLFWVLHVNILCPRFAFVVCHSISVCDYLSRSLHLHTYTSQPVVAGRNPNKWYQSNGGLVRRHVQTDRLQLLVRICKVFYRHEGNKADVLGEKIRVMFKNKNTVKGSQSSEIS